ncbi:uncharacterized protein LOC111777776 [Cucurbita pepo subsp. pepo]|uniref:uncharacterized protein LOC111777776 n=1 Tax=Cucurbita pepo subsp. pepo TaxID=3664 RepID=UPI000C9D9940|nr:uncharacterized protein LOC111777776 [Cucurbita pepo subsp. pepo]
MYYLGIEVNQMKDCIMLKQSDYVKKLLQQFKITKCNPTKYPMETKLQLGKDAEENLVNSTKYRRVIGSLRYLTHTRPDLSYVVGIMSSYMEKPTMMHHQVVKHILHYVKGTTSYGLKYQRG